MNANIKPSNRAVLVGVIDPDANTAATYTTGWIDMANFENIQAIILAGTLGSSATLNAKLEQTTDSSLSPESVKDVTGKAITALTQAGTDSDKQAIINCRADDLDVANSYRYVRLSMTVGTATSDCAAVVLGHDARFAPADDVSTVDEVV